MACAIPDKHLECAVCMEHFKEPKVLPCLHTFCKDCLKGLIKKQGSDHGITCPECRQDAKIADGNVNKLQPNFWINNFMTLMSIKNSDSSSKSIICELCDSGDTALSRCTYCRVFMCKFCETAHRRMNTFKGHEILTLAEVQKLGSKALVKPAFCKKHAGETLKLFCETCQQTICRDCTIVDHRDHKYNFVADVAERERKSIQAILQDTKAKDNAVEEGLKAVETMESRVEAKISEVSKEVDVFFDDQVKVLGYLRRDLQNKLKSQGKVKLTELRSQREMLTFSLAQLRSSVEFAERALGEGDDTELLSMKHELTERLSQLNALQYQCRPCKSDYLALQVNKTIQDVGEMATILYQPVDPTKCALSMVGGEEGVMYQTLAGQPVDFLLVIKFTDEKQDIRRCIRAVVSHSKEVHLQHALPVNTLEDGSYSFSYKPDTSGVCTLSLTVEGESVCGSPLTWTVKPKVTRADQMSHLTSSTNQDEGNRGLHCWKLKFQCHSGRNPLEVGVKCVTPADGIKNFFALVTKRCTWCCVTGPRPLKFFSRSDNPEDASISSVKVGDIFSCYLNYDTKKLIIYNQRSKQSEIFTDVEGEIIAPIVVPSCSYQHDGPIIVVMATSSFTLGI
ncbi:PREDICTED: tripartite motif-containing protein 45-like [Acropora digitifera]|uniref:tripartite motif-containing protein 45-like n=1 Tax=Acropora digitifera TaxID=70779 RepID=UPI00077B1702|nr:PREDICTED: tripartite motif-containing protein 45-like [Acropora digitifera]